MSVSFASSVRAVMAAGALLLAMDPAAARRIVTDTGWNQPEIGVCYLGSETTCNPTSLGFTVRLNGVNYDKVWLYDQGVVSFGGKLGTGSPTITLPLGDIGFSWEAPQLIYAESGSPFVTPEGRKGIQFDWFYGAIEKDLLTKTATVQQSGFALAGVQLLEYKPGVMILVVLNDGQIDPSFGTLSFGNLVYNLSDPDSEALFIELQNQLGQGQGGYQLYGEDLPIDPKPPIGVIPEPATWAMMLAGFGLVGGAIRRKRAEAVPAI